MPYGNNSGGLKGKTFVGDFAMDFRLSEEQQMLKDMARKIAENEFGPRAAEIDLDAICP